MDKKTADAFLEELRKVTNDLASKYNVQAKVRGSYGANDARFSVTINDLVVSESGSVVTARAIQWGVICQKDITTPFTYQGEKFKVVDYNSKARRFPWLCEGETGRRIRFTDDTIPSLITA